MPQHSQQMIHLGGWVVGEKCVGERYNLSVKEEKVICYQLKLEK